MESLDHPWAFVLLAVATSGWGVWSIVDRLRMLANGVHRTAKVVDWVLFKEFGEQDRYFLVVRFADAYGRTQQIELKIHYYEKKFLLGSDYPIICDPNHPNKILSLRARDLLFQPLMILGFSAFFIYLVFTRSP